MTSLIQILKSKEWREGKRRSHYLILIPEISERGGIEVFSRSFLQSVVNFLKNFEVSVIILNQKLSDLARVLGFNDKNISLFCCGSKFRIFKKIKFAIFFVSLLLIKRPKSIISTHINLLKFYIFLYPLFKIRYLLITYGIEVWSMTFLKRIILQNAAIITALSNYTAEKIKKVCGEDQRIIIFPPVVDDKKFYPVPKDRGLLEKYDLIDKKIILTVCRLNSKEKYKGYDKIIIALSKISSEIPNVKYLIVGEGDDIYRVKSLIKKMKLETKVISCGFVPDGELVKYYNLCDVFVMPSKGEGFGIVFLEALACGKPVIAGNKDGSRDALLNGDIGILVDPDNIDEIVEAIVEVLQEKVPKKLIDSDYLRKRVLQVYGIDKFNERVENLLREMG